MPGLFASLDSSASTLTAYENALTVVQNNIGNASTPDFATQTAQFAPAPFDPIDGLPGGVASSTTASTRNENAERYVQQQNSQLGTAEATVSSLSPVEPAFDVTGNSGLDAALNQFFSAFSDLAQTPSSSSAQQQAIYAAQNVASAFQATASATAAASQNTDQQIGSTVSQINALASQIASINQQQTSAPQTDPNLDATLHQDLESLSNLANITYSQASNGSYTVLIGGESPLVIGGNSYAISSGLAPVSASATEPNATPPRQILDSSGNDITSQISSGQLAGFLNTRNTVLASIQGDPYQPGSLNTLAKSFADRVNSLLTSGEISAGPPAVSGLPLFQYSGPDDTSTASTLSLTGITAQQIATIDPGPPGVANGIAQTIGNLPDSTNPSDQINGLTFSAFYGQVASSLGQQIATAQTNQTQGQQSYAQAQNLRSQISGVSLDQQAVDLLQFQRAYEATSKLVTTLDQLTEDTINMMPQT